MMLHHHRQFFRTFNAPRFSLGLLMISMVHQPFFLMIMPDVLATYGVAQPQ
jgi:hypothetical protein